MATLKQRLHRKNASGTFDTVHLETSSDLVLRPSGNTVEQDLVNQNNEINSLKTSVSSGKAAIASAVTDKGVQTAADATFNTMAQNIRSISSAPKYTCCSWFCVTTGGSVTSEPVNTEDMDLNFYAPDNVDITENSEMQVYLSKSVLPGRDGYSNRANYFNVTQLWSHLFTETIHIGPNEQLFSGSWFNGMTYTTQLKIPAFNLSPYVVSSSSQDISQIIYYKSIRITVPFKAWAPSGGANVSWLFSAMLHIF